ncbi:hypothetical protein Bca4012_038904 [Brassica carinata]
MIICSKPKRKTSPQKKRDTETMSAMKIQLTSLILAFFLLFSQSTAKCDDFYTGYPEKGPCNTNDDCQELCQHSSKDPTFKLCILAKAGSTYDGKCLCLGEEQIG